MVTFSVRFYGRFLLARERSGGKPTGRVTFIAPNLEFPPEIGLHNPVMSISRSAMPIDSVLKTAAPSWRSISKGQPQEAEHLMWDLRDTSVIVPSTGGLVVNEEAFVPDLGKLESVKGRSGKLDHQHLKPGDLVGATIRMAGGQGKAIAAFANSAEFIPESDARDGDPDNDVTDPNVGVQTIADFIEIAVSVKSRMTARGERGCLALQLQGRTNGTVLVEAGVQGADIGFSNLCASCPMGASKYDLEFGQYYRLLEQTGPDRLVPMINHLGDEDCNESAQIWYDV